MSYNLSEIQEFYRGSTVFLTGATGSLGKLVLEKLLRGCPGIRHIYVLIRIKKGKDTDTRFKEIFECPIFEKLQRKNPSFPRKVTLMNGDCARINLGLSDQDVDIIVNEVTCIIHCAATVRFDQKLSLAAKINLRATRDLLQIAKKAQNLKAYVHVSTAYSNCDKTEIDEVIYPPKLEGEKLLTAVDSLDDQLLLDIQPRLLGKLPNTYTLTKQIAESDVRKFGQTLPLCIVRPSIIISLSEEPLPGYIDNYYGPTGLLLAGCLGIMRSFLGNRKNVADLVPGDYVVNAILAAACYTSKKRVNREPTDPEVFNFVSGPENPITLGKLHDSLLDIGFDYPSPKIVAYPWGIVQPNPYLHAFLWVTLHVIPAYIVDFMAVALGKKAQLVNLYAKLWKLNDVISYFPMRQWTFSNSNTRKLYNQMSNEDKKLFYFSMKEFSWEDYIPIYLKGIRVYICKDPMETIEAGMKHLRKLKIIFISIIIAVALLTWLLIRYISSFVF